MIRVTVKKRNGSYVSLTSKGHAGYADEGYDIISAAVSVLIINTVNSIETFTDDIIEAEDSDGYVSMNFPKPLSEKGMLLMDSLILGLTQIEHNYKSRYLTLKVKEV